MVQYDKQKRACESLILPTSKRKRISDVKRIGSIILFYVRESSFIWQGRGGGGGGEDIETQSLKFSAPLASHSSFWLVVGSSKLGECEGKHFLEEQECNNEITDYILLSKPHDIAEFAQVIIKFCWVEIWSVWCHGLVLKNTKLLENPPPSPKFFFLGV